jgi:tetratricopeptide (TPR) repeat protein
MKKNIFQFASLTTLLIFYCGSLFAKNNYSQSTLDELKTLNGNVTKAVSENDSLAMARAYYKLALKYDYIDENDSCYLYYRKAIKIAKQINNVRAEAIISNAFATTYSDRGLHKEAIEIYDHIIKLFLSQKDSTGAGGVMLNTGAEYLEMGNYEKGLQLSLDALNIKLMSSDSSNIAGFYKQISTIFDLVGNKEKRKEYILLANQIAKKDERYSDFYIRMDILNELGGYYFNMGDYNLATKYYDTLYIKSTQKDYLVGITASTSNLVPILKTEGKYSEALVLSKKALALSQKGGKPYRIVHNLVETAKLEIILFNKNIAAKRLLNAKALAIEYNFPDELITIYKLLAEIYFDNNLLGV